jgi:hypothetical protein
VIPVQSTRGKRQGLWCTSSAKADAVQCTPGQGSHVIPVQSTCDKMQGLWCSSAKAELYTRSGISRDSCTIYLAKFRGQGVHHLLKQMLYSVQQVRGLT